MPTFCFDRLSNPETQQITRPYEEIFQDYMSRLTEMELGPQGDMATTLLEKGPLQPVCALVPVHTDDIDLVDNALKQYARQRYAGETNPVAQLPFTVYLGVNGSKSEQAATSELEGLKRSVANHPKLDVRITYRQYDPQITIGSIRRDMWNAVAIADKEPQQNTVCVNHDIDIDKLPYFYMASISDWTNSPRATDTPVFTQMRFAQAPDTLPNAQKFITWKNFLRRQSRHLYEQSLVMPLKYYMKVGGFRREVALGEAYGLVSKREELQTGYALTSPRRQLAYGFETAYSDGFNADEVYRKDSAPSDLSEAALANEFNCGAMTLQRIPAELNGYSHRLIPPLAPLSSQDAKELTGKIEADWLRIVRHQTNFGSRIIQLLNLSYIPEGLLAAYPTRAEKLPNFYTTHVEIMARQAVHKLLRDPRQQ